MTVRTSGGLYGWLPDGSEAIGTSPAFRKNYYSGALMMLIGMTVIYANVSYMKGSIARLGFGTLPCLVGLLLAVTGLLMSSSVHAQSGLHTRAQQDSWSDLRGGICCSVALLAFIFFGRYFGLVPATFAIVLITSVGDRSNTLRDGAVLALTMCALSALLLRGVLGLQLSLFKWCI